MFSITCSRHFLQVNEGVRSQENTDRLEWLQTHVNLESIGEVSILDFVATHFSCSFLGRKATLKATLDGKYDNSKKNEKNRKENMFPTLSTVFGLVFGTLRPMELNC